MEEVTGLRKKDLELDKEVSFSPSELLKKEIISFRGSALENRSTESSSQAKEKDNGRLRAVLELVADYELGIDLPGDLIAKLMVQGERSAPEVRFSVEHDTSSSTSQTEVRKKQLGQTETVLVRHNGVDEENLGTTLPADVSPSNETSNGNHILLSSTHVTGEGTEEKTNRPYEIDFVSPLVLSVLSYSIQLHFHLRFISIRMCALFTVVVSEVLDFERFIMDCNKEEATRAINLAEEKMRGGDFVGAHKLIMKAQRLFPELENIQKLLAVCDVHSSADKKIKGLDDWYGILQVQPSADSDTIKKQYRKLCLLLHPDKNKFPGAEAAFKFVGEANRWLSDQSKRSQYDVRYRSHSLFASKESNANSLRNSSSANAAAVNIASGLTFWTCCRSCGHRYKYLKVYVNQLMHCSSCKKSYTACNIGSDGVSFSGSTAGVKQFQDQGISRQHPSTGAESGSSAAEMDKNGTVGGKLNKRNRKKQKRGSSNKKPKKDEGCTESEAEGGGTS
ncbi:hypothetical protein F2Q70_00023995, partial [Brassica cretica]